MSGVNENDKRFWCGHCDKSWARKALYDDHFNLEKVKNRDSGGHLIVNPCYQRSKKRRAMGMSLEEAKSKRKMQEKLTEMFVPIVRDPVDIQQSASTVMDESSNKVTLDADEMNIDVTDEENNPPGGRTEDESDVNASKDIKKDDLLHNKVDHIINELKEIKIAVASKQSEDIPRPSTSSSNIPKADDEFENLVKKISSPLCRSMTEILNNPVVLDIFELEERTREVVEMNEGNNNDGNSSEEEVETQNFLVCKVCQEWSKIKSKGMSVQDSEYSAFDVSGRQTPMERWFRNFKIKLTDHLMSDIHQMSLKEEMTHNAKYYKVKHDIYSNMRQISYFMLKANVPFVQFPALLATVQGCNVELGDINHTKVFLNINLAIMRTEGNI